MRIPVFLVVAVSEPKFSVTSAEGGGVTLQCEANCWLPEPQINFLDERGKYIRAEETQRDEDANECFTVTRRVTLRDAAANRFKFQTSIQTLPKACLVPLLKRN